MVTVQLTPFSRKSTACSRKWSLDRPFACIAALLDAVWGNPNGCWRVGVPGCFVSCQNSLSFQQSQAHVEVELAEPGGVGCLQSRPQVRPRQSAYFTHSDTQTSHIGKPQVHLSLLPLTKRSSYDGKIQLHFGATRTDLQHWGCSVSCFPHSKQRPSMQSHLLSSLEKPHVIAPVLVPCHCLCCEEAQQHSQQDRCSLRPQGRSVLASKRSASGDVVTQQLKQCRKGLGKQDTVADCRATGPLNWHSVGDQNASATSIAIQRSAPDGKYSRRSPMKVPT